MWVAVAYIIGLLVSVIGTGLLIKLLPTWGLVDVPNARSNHVRSTPRGGGISIVVTFTLLFLLLAITQKFYTPFLLTLLLAIWGLAAISLWDDFRPLSPFLRLGVQCSAVAIALTMMPTDIHIFKTLPLIVERIFVGLSWIWCINFFNFMDGINGITGAESLSITGGIFLLTTMVVLPPALYFGSITLAIAVFGFLLWNWHPAKIFMGDVGSIPLGFIIGWMLIEVAGRGFLAAALILPAYYVLDSTLTLLHRLLQGKKPWQAHSEHYYQKAVRAGAAHDTVVKQIIGTNLLLIGCALGTARYPTFAYLFIFIAIMVTLHRLGSLLPAPMHSSKV